MTTENLVNSIFNIQTGKEIIVEYSKEETTKILSNQEAERIAEIEFKKKQKAVLDKLGITEDEAKLLLS